MGMTDNRLAVKVIEKGRPADIGGGLRGIGSAWLRRIGCGWLSNIRCVWLLSLVGLFWHVLKCGCRHSITLGSFTGMIVLGFERNFRKYEIDLLSKCRCGLRQLLGRNSKMPIRHISPG